MDTDFLTHAKTQRKTDCQGNDCQGNGDLRRQGNGRQGNGEEEEEGRVGSGPVGKWESGERGRTGRTCRTSRTELDAEGVQPPSGLEIFFGTFSLGSAPQPSATPGYFLQPPSGYRGGENRKQKVESGRGRTGRTCRTSRTELDAEGVQPLSGLETFYGGRLSRVAPRSPPQPRAIFSNPLRG
jgi:hypothetical protein